MSVHTQNLLWCTPTNEVFCSEQTQVLRTGISAQCSAMHMYHYNPPPPPPHRPAGVEKPELSNGLPLSMKSVRITSQACFAQCQDLFLCRNFYLPGQFTFVFSTSSPCFLTVLVLANTVSHVSPQDMSTH